MASAFESITTRQSWYGATAIAQYEAVEIDADGKYAKATGARPFAGIVEYGCDAADQMVTVVRGTFPGFSAEEIPAGSLVTADATNPGMFKVCPAGTAATGIALTPATGAGETFTVHMLENAFTPSV